MAIGKYHKENCNCTLCLGIANKGNHFSAETRKKISDKVRERFSNPANRLPRSEETKAKIRLAHLGKVFSEEHKLHISQGKKGGIPWNKGLKGYYCGVNSSFYGKNHTEESKRKNAEKHKRENLKPSTLEKMRTNALNRIMSVETRMKISKANKNKVRTMETRQRMCLARRKRVIPFKDTKIEMALQDELTNRKIAYEKHKSMIGLPDIFIEPDICIFADGDYWHNLPNRQEHDKEINQQLIDEGYLVLRYWEHEINDNVDGCVDEIGDVLFVRGIKN